MQNATRHNVPHGTAYIATGVDRRTGSSWIRTENDGAAYSIAMATQLAEPFLRGTGRVRAGLGGADVKAATGHGFGLALVARIIEELPMPDPVRNYGQRGLRGSGRASQSLL